jgi:hypothetical protein
VIDHIEELAELYAVGSLDDLERARVERHARECVQCAQRLHEAEETVAAIAQTQPAFEAPARLRRRLRTSLGDRGATKRAVWRPAIAAAAAAVVLALVPSWLAVENTRKAVVAMRQDERALARLASAPFDRAQFMSQSKRAMDAKVLYGPRGDWYYVVVMHPKPNMRVAYVHAGKMEMLGPVAMHGESGTLFLPVNHKMEELALLEGDTVVAHAHLVY